MSGDKWYRIDLHDHRERLGDGVTIVPSTSDVPVEFAVDVVDDDIIRIRLRYPYLTNEPTITTRMESVDFTVGQFSHRLFSIEINIERMGARTRREFEAKLQRALWSAFERLRQRTSLGGPRLNYLAASEGLGIDPAGSETPAWMADAVERMRLENSGSHSR